MLACFMAISPTLVLMLLIASFLQHVSSLLVNLSIVWLFWRDHKGRVLCFFQSETVALYVWSWSLEIYFPYLSWTLDISDVGVSLFPPWFTHWVPLPVSCYNSLRKGSVVTFLRPSMARNTLILPSHLITNLTGYKTLVLKGSSC